MGQPVMFEQANVRLGPPEGMTEDEVGYLPAMFTGKHYVSCWSLTEEELAEIASTGCIWLSVMGKNMPPVYVGSAETTTEVINN